MSYNTDANGTITDLGKFEAEPSFVPYFWGKGLDDMEDADENNVWFFIVSPEDVKEFPSLANVYGVALEEIETGFVYHETFATKEAYEKQLSRLESLGEQVFEDED